MDKNKEKNIKISIIIPVYREQNINLHLESLLNNPSYKQEEIIIVDGDNSSTIKNIQNDNVLKIDSKKGRANQMNEGARIAQGDILLFLHADTLLPNNAFDLIRRSCTNEDIQAGAFDLSFSKKSIALKIISITASFRSRLTRLPYGDQAIFIKKDIFDTIGAYESIALMEDVNLMQKLKKMHYKIEIHQEKVITSSRKWEEKGILYTTLRNWILISLYFLKIDPNILSKYYK